MFNLSNGLDEMVQSRKDSILNATQLGMCRHRLLQDLRYKIAVFAAGKLSHDRLMPIIGEWRHRNVAVES